MKYKIKIEVQADYDGYFHDVVKVEKELDENIKGEGLRYVGIIESIFNLILAIEKNVDEFISNKDKQS